MVAQHVHHGHAAQDGGEEIRPLDHGRAHEQPAVAAAFDGNPPRRRVALRDQVLRGRDEVVEDVLLPAEHAGPVPSLAVLSSATEIREREEAAAIEEQGVARIERGRPADVESAVAAQEHRPLPVAGEICTVDQEHRDSSSVPGRIPDLGSLVVRRLSVSIFFFFRLFFRLEAEATGSNSFRLRAKDHRPRRLREGGKHEPDLVVIRLGIDRHDRSQAGQGNFPLGRPFKGEQHEPVARILKTGRDQPVACHDGARQAVRGLRNDFLHARGGVARGVVWIQGDDPPARCVLRRAEEQPTSCFLDELVGRVEAGEHRARLG